MFRFGTASLLILLTLAVLTASKLVWTATCQLIFWNTGRSVIICLLIQNFALICTYIYFFWGGEGVGVWSIPFYLWLVFACLFCLHYVLQYFVFSFIHSHGIRFKLRQGLGEKWVWGRFRWSLMAVLSTMFLGMAVNTLVDSHARERSCSCWFFNFVWACFLVVIARLWCCRLYESLFQIALEFFL